MFVQFKNFLYVKIAWISWENKIILLVIFVIKLYKIKIYYCYVVAIACYVINVIKKYYFLFVQNVKIYMIRINMINIKVKTAMWIF